MKTARNFRRWVVWIIVAALVISLGLPAMQANAQEGESLFGKEELVQMLAPIALYPDSLIAQILMASTYPLEVVEAERWRSANQELQGDAFYDALQEKTWDPSVKALCHFPDVLFAMSDKLDQTRKLGDAFLAQEQEVMATIQELRGKAMAQGNLKTTPEQQVIVEREIIRIEPASPQVVYVPVYDPYTVYGPWWYPAYPPYYWHYPYRPYGSAVSFSFGPRIFIGSGFFSWVWFDWHVHRIHIDVTKTFRFHRHRVRPSHDRFYWRHDPYHRRGVAYRDRRTTEHFGAPVHRSPTRLPETRGFPAGTTEGRPSGSSGRSGPSRERTAPPQTRSEPRSLQPAPQQIVPPSRSGPRRERSIAPEAGREQRGIRPAPAQDTPFRGFNDGGFERRSGERGEESRRGRERERRDDRRDDDSRGRGGGSRR